MTTTFAGRFAGKVAVVTGAAQGIGREVALRLAREGGKVALVDRSELVEEVRRPLLFLAGGTGLAPFLSMLGRLAEAGTGAQPIHLVYGVTNDADLVGVDQLEQYAARVPGFTFSSCVAAEGSAHPRKGYVTAHIDPAHLNGGEVDVYLCGPPPMVDAVRAWLGERGVAPANFYYEKFSPSGAVTAIGEDHRRAA